MNYSQKFYLEKQNNTAKTEAGFRTNLFEGKDFVSTEDAEYRACTMIYKVMKSRQTVEEKNDVISRLIAKTTNSEIGSVFMDARAYTGEAFVKARKKRVTKADKIAERQATMKEWVKKLHKFLSEFQMPVSFRLVSTLASVEDPTIYLLNYFKLQDNPYTLDVADKLESAEWEEIANAFKEYEMTQEPINKRIKAYFGEPGTGKTTEAAQQADYTKVCSADMLPSDLMQDFDFEKGQPTFKKSELWLAIEKGKTILLDEINLLPQESLCFIQALTDGKESFDYKGTTIKVHKDFNIIGTMNLYVNGVTLPLTSPLVDRCSEIIEYKLNPENLVSAL